MTILFGTTKICDYSLFPFLPGTGSLCSLGYILVPQPPGVFDSRVSHLPPPPPTVLSFKCAQAGSSMGGGGWSEHSLGMGLHKGSLLLIFTAVHSSLVAGRASRIPVSLCTSVASLSLWGSDSGPPACTARASPIKPLLSHDCCFLMCD